jgi:putative oxidoreductase
VEIGILLLRLAIGLVLAAHGTQKLFDWFGGPGLAGVGGSFENLGFRPGKLYAFLAGASQIGGGLLLALGLLTPLGAAAAIAVMLVAAVSVHAKAFFVQNGGFEYALVIAVIALFVTFTGPGPVSLDAAFGLPLAGPRWAAAALVVGIACAIVTLRNRRPPGNEASPLRADHASAVTSDAGEIQRECAHSAIEHLGSNRGARFYRCEGCRLLFIVEGDSMLALRSTQPGAPSRPSSLS